MLLFVLHIVPNCQYHMTWFLHCVPNWLLPRPFDLIWSICTQLTHFKTMWPGFYIVYILLSECTQLTLQHHMTWFLYCVPNWLLSGPSDLILSQHHIAWFLYCVPNWLLSRPFDLILSIYQCAPNWLISRPYDPRFTLCTYFEHCVPNWLLSKPYNLTFALCTQSTPFNAIWPNFVIVYPIDCCQDHIAWFLYCVPNWLISRPYDMIFCLS